MTAAPSLTPTHHPNPPTPRRRDERDAMAPDLDLLLDPLAVAVAEDRERGEVSTTTVILTFILAGLALAVGAIIVSKVTAKANSIPTD